MMRNHCDESALMKDFFLAYSLHPFSSMDTQQKRKRNYKISAPVSRLRCFSIRTDFFSRLTNIIWLDFNYFHTLESLVKSWEFFLRKTAVFLSHSQRNGPRATTTKIILTTNDVGWAEEGKDCAPIRRKSSLALSQGNSNNLSGFPPCNWFRRRIRFTTRIRFHRRFVDFSRKFSLITTVFVIGKSVWLENPSIDFHVGGKGHVPFTCVAFWLSGAAIPLRRLLSPFHLSKAEAGSAENRWYRTFMVSPFYWHNGTY